MSLINNDYYKYSYCIIQTESIIRNYLQTLELNSNDCSRLQLLAISLDDVNDELFQIIKIILNILNSNLASLCQREITDEDIFLLNIILFVIFLMIYFLSLSYQTLALNNNQDLTVEQIYYILSGYNMNQQLRMKRQEIDNDILIKISNLPVSEWNKWLNLI